MTGENLKNVDFSVIIPVYNSSSYLEQCIQSVLSQTYKNLEIILINDGSTDDSLSICNRLAKGNARVKVFDQKNKGQGSARNLGLKHANGTYILFVDSDDALAKNTIDLNYQILEKDPSIECLQFPIFMKYGTEDAYIRKNIEKKYQLESNEFKKLILVDNVISWIVCDKIIKRDFLIGVYFPEDMIYEDNYLMLNLIEKLKSIYISDKGMYYYYRRENSTTTSKFTLKSELSTLKVLLKTLSLLKSSDNTDLMLKYLIRLINVDKSLKTNFNFVHDEVSSYKYDLNYMDVIFNNLNLKDKLKLAIYKWF